MTRFPLYLASLASANNLGEGIQWLFYPGMLADSKSKWWADFGHRHASHEGIDLCFYQRSDGTIRHIETGAAVPAWSNGTVLHICEDFLGHTLVVEPDKKIAGPTRILEVFSHLDPDKSMAPCTRVKAGQIIARTSDIMGNSGTQAQKPVLLPHLHLSCIEVPAHTPVTSLNWTLFCLREKVNVLNPVFM
ncbi:MAG: hypothetical protein ABR534_02035 [Desulfotignum sp.]|nr:M23 family metallopeptidase [Desulfobacteraceae bacterium]